MDIKKHYEDEYKLENMRPQFTEEELLDTISLDEKKATQEIVSFSLTPGADGIYLKTVDKDGNQSQQQSFNLVAAESLAHQLIDALKSHGAEGFDFAEDELNSSKKSLH